IAISRGVAVDSKIPAAIPEALTREGLAPATVVPVGLTSQQAAAATKICAFDELPTDLKGDAEVTYWAGCRPRLRIISAREAQSSGPRGGDRLNECAIATERVRVRDLSRRERMSHIRIKLR